MDDTRSNFPYIGGGGWLGGVGFLNKAIRLPCIIHAVFNLGYCNCHFSRMVIHCIHISKLTICPSHVYLEKIYNVQTVM